METPVTEFDTLTFSHSLQLLKAALPYMNNSRQKNLVMFIKIFELKNAMTLLHDENSQLSACSDEDNETRILHMFNHIRQFCNEKEQEFIDLFINFNQAFQLFSSYQNTMPENNENNNTMFELIKNMMTPEQQTAYESYSKMFT